MSPKLCTLSDDCIEVREAIDEATDDTEEAAREKIEEAEDDTDDAILGEYGCFDIWDLSILRSGEWVLILRQAYGGVDVSPKLVISLVAQYNI